MKIRLYFKIESEFMIMIVKQDHKSFRMNNSL